MNFVLIALGVVILMVVAKDQAQLRKWNAAREYTDGEPRGAAKEY